MKVSLRIRWGLAIFCSATAFLVPIYSPDIFWHLSAGQWMLEQHRIPATDFLSFTKSGQPWVDFEWLAQIIYRAAYSCGQMWGLWALKVLLLAASALILLRLLRTRRFAANLQPAALILWSANILAFSDIRPDLFSLLLFSWLLMRLETVTLPLSWQRLLATAAFFAIWANLHAGFFLGLGLLWGYAAYYALRGERLESRRHMLFSAAATLGTFFTPYGSAAYLVLWEHLRLRSRLVSHIVEWQPMDPTLNAFWPFWSTVALLAAAAAAVLWRARRLRGDLPLALPCLALILGLGSLLHQRFALFFATAAVAATGLVIREAEWDDSAGLRRAADVVMALGAVFVIGLAPRIGRAQGAFDYRHVPYSAAEFMASHRPVIEPLRVYHELDWGGYLGWRLRPWFRQFGDGRYLFHPQVPRVWAAMSAPERWAQFVSEERLGGAIVPNFGVTFPAAEIGRGEGRPGIPRPWYHFFFPRQRWALVYWDDRLLFFVDRHAVPAAWLKATEYRFLLPRDEAGLQESLRRGEVPKAAAAEELRRHAQEMRRPSG